MTELIDVSPAREQRAVKRRKRTSDPQNVLSASDEPADLPEIEANIEPAELSLYDGFYLALTEPECSTFFESDAFISMKSFEGKTIELKLLKLRVRQTLMTAMRDFVLSSECHCRLEDEDFNYKITHLLIRHWNQKINFCPVCGEKLTVDFGLSGTKHDRCIHHYFKQRSPQNVSNDRKLFD